jgi:hypothetical protein
LFCFGLVRFFWFFAYKTETEPADFFKILIVFFFGYLFSGFLGLIGFSVFLLTPSKEEINWWEFFNILQKLGDDNFFHLRLGWTFLLKHVYFCVSKMLSKNLNFFFFTSNYYFFSSWIFFLFSYVTFFHTVKRK